MRFMVGLAVLFIVALNWTVPASAGRKIVEGKQTRRFGGRFGRFLQTNPRPTRSRIIDAMDQNLCRCGAHVRIVQAIQTAAEEMKGGAS